jgi:hypothetical protein
MPLENFGFFALHYLNDWCSDDRHFVAGVQPEKATPERVASLWKAAVYYKVTRTLPTIQEERLAGALAAIDEVATPITDATVDAAVCGLATRFRELYGRYAISAASKLLWVRHQSPVVILDGQADLCLRSTGCRFDKGDYRGYRREWRRRFTDREQAIREACTDLRRARDFSLASAMPSEEFATLTASRWFHERVFDKFLWWNSSAR